MGQERDRLLARRVEQALGAQLRAQALEALELVAEADVPHRRDAEAEVARLHEVVGLDARDDVVADLEVRRQPLRASDDQMRNEMSASVPRSLRRPNTLPPRRFHEVISPSTQTEPQFVDEAADRLVEP